MTTVVTFPWKPGTLLRPTCELSTVERIGDKWSYPTDGVVKGNSTLMLLDAEKHPTWSMYTGTATVLMRILLADGEIMHIPIPEDSIPLGGRLHRWFEELS
jgi:hypothetical protein